MSHLIHSYILDFKGGTMKNKVLSILFLIVIFGIMFLGTVLPDKSVSVAERRKLASFPKIQIETIMNGDFFEDLNHYLVEQFPARDWFRKLKGVVSNHLFQKKDEDGVFVHEGAIYQLDQSINEKSIAHFTDLLNKVQNQYLKTDHVYYGIIPDKNYFLDDTIPKLDYEKMQLLLNQELTNMEYINLMDTLNLDSYYKTDIHWKQECLASTVAKIEEAMNLRKTEIPNEKQYYSKFYGALYGRIANNLPPDQLTYVMNDDIKNANVFDYEKQEYRKVYEEKDLTNIDSYDIYLGGAKPLLIIENENQTNGKELVLFRDSFGSSIAPLLISNYSKITLIDLRYISSELLSSIEEVDLSSPNLDVLFLYSIPIINNSFTLK